MGNRPGNSIKFLSNESNISYNSLLVFFQGFLNKGIVIKTRRVGKSDMYKLNADNPAVKELIKLDWKLVKGVEQKIIA